MEQQQIEASMFNIWDRITGEWLDYEWAVNAGAAQGKFLSHRPEFQPEEISALEGAP